MDGWALPAAAQLPSGDEVACGVNGEADDVIIVANVEALRVTSLEKKEGGGEG